MVASVEPGDTVLKVAQRTHQGLEGLPGQGWNAAILETAARFRKLALTGSPLRRDQPESAQVSAQRVGRHPSH